MKTSLIHMKFILLAALASCVINCSAELQPMGVGSRKENKDGNILVSYDRDNTNKYFPGAILSVMQKEKQSNNLIIKTCLEFVDAKYDEKANQLAVVFLDGLYLVYQRYTLNNRDWKLEQDVKLVEYNLPFTLYGNRLELSDLRTLRASFIKKGERFRKGDRQKGVENPDDKVHFIRVSEAGTVMIDNQERKDLRWHPEVGTKSQSP